MKDGIDIHTIYPEIKTDLRAALLRMSRQESYDYNCQCCTISSETHTFSF